MRISGFGLPVALGVLLTIVLLSAGPATARLERSREAARVSTDGHLRVGHLETIEAKGLPGKGFVAVSFFPTAICEDGCSARTLLGGRTDAQGAATFRVRVPGTFKTLDGRPVYYRDRERVDVLLSWEGSDGSFATADGKGAPVIVRAHGGSDG